MGYIIVWAVIILFSIADIAVAIAIFPLILYIFVIRRFASGPIVWGIVFISWMVWIALLYGGVFHG